MRDTTATEEAGVSRDTGLDTIGPRSPCRNRASCFIEHEQVQLDALLLGVEVQYVLVACDLLVAHYVKLEVDHIFFSKITTHEVY